MKRILNTGWVSFLVLGLILFMCLLPDKEGTPNPIPLLSPFYVYIGAVVGNAFRIYGMPDTYFTDGTLISNIKTRFYWNHGPQMTGMVLSFITVLALLGTPS